MDKEDQVVLLERWQLEEGDVRRRMWRAPMSRERERWHVRLWRMPADPEPAPCLTRGMGGGSRPSLGTGCPHYWPMVRGIGGRWSQDAGF